MVTGICIPCDSMGHAASVALSYNLNGNVLKVGKSVNQWYVVVQFTTGA